MTRLTDAALSELARLAGEATPGPWIAGGGGYIGYAVEDARGEVIVYDEGSPSDADAAYIAAANPATVAALVAEVRALRAGIGEWAHHLRAAVRPIWDTDASLAVVLVAQAMEDALDGAE